MRVPLVGILALVVAAATFGAAAGRASAASAGTTVVRHHHTAGVSRHGSVRRLTPAAHRLVLRAMRQTTAASSTQFVCLPAAASSNSAAAQSCTITAPAGVCIEVSSNPSVTQSCTFTQSSATRSNIAVAIQVIDQRDTGQIGSKQQTGSQTVTTTQGNASGSNFNWTTQIVKQFLGHGADQSDSELSQQQKADAQQELAGTPADLTSLIQGLAPGELAQENALPATLPLPTASPVSQQQQSQQTVTVCQGSTADCHSQAGMTGNNVSGVYQSLRQWEWANNAPSIDQQQNSSPGTCTTSGSATLNMCANVSQTTTGGKNLSGLFEAYRQFQRALHTLAGDQIQDAPTSFDAGGLGHDVSQTSVVADPTGPQRNWIVTGQLARQDQNATDTGALTQSQDPHVDKGPASTQTGTTHDTWHGLIYATQSQLANGQFASPADQFQRLTYDGVSTGDIVATVTGTENGSTNTEQCTPGDTGDVCHAEVDCASVVPGAPPLGGAETLAAPGCTGFAESGPPQQGGG
ncbi:MAG TPA: hypothetical protein VFA05_09300 [Gaiellaceae bacterium]|nr:hypothetical protein [Gaiellaceae bacterium]